jgi:hypothetical protein
MMESGLVVVSKWEKALKGTALLVAELVPPAVPAPWLMALALEVRALGGGASVLAEGV